MAAEKSNIAPIIAAIIGFFALGVLVGWALNSSAAQSTSVKTPEATPSSQLTNAFLSCDTSISTVNSTEYEAFQKQIQTYIDAEKTQGTISQLAIYFRDLSQGGWFGIDESKKFSPASLLKVPDMVALLHLGDSNPSILKKQLKYDHVFSTEQPNYPPEQLIELGQTYTVDDLIYRMIVYSDNEAMFLLRSNFDSSVFDNIYDELGLVVPNDASPDDFMTVKSNAAFFRVLFNASYLSQTASEKALKILSEVKFNKGLVAGVPAGTVVAHKFGERQFTDTGVTQLHDCGIIYYPKHPYLLCIMSRGNSYNTLEKIISELSKIVWNEIDRRISISVAPAPK